VHRLPTLSTWIGVVAVFDRALSDDEMKGSPSSRPQEKAKSMAGYGIGTHANT